MAEEIDPVNQRVAELLSFGVPEQDIVSHLSKSKDESHKLWVQKWKSSQTAERAAERIPPTEQPVATELQKLQKLAEENPITAAGLATAVTAAAGLGTYAIKSRMDTAAKIREAKALAKLEPSEAVKIQREQLDLAKQKFQAEQDKLIKFENNKAIVATRPNPLAASFEEKFKIPFAEAERLSKGKITNAADAEIIGNALTKGQGFSVNPMPGAVSNQPAGIPGAVNPMNELTVQPPTPQMIQPKPPAGAVVPQAPTAVGTLAAGGTPTQIATQTAAQTIDDVNQHPAVLLSRQMAAEAEAIRNGAVDLTSQRAHSNAINQEVDIAMSNLRNLVDKGLASDSDIIQAQDIIKKSGSKLEAVNNVTRFLKDIEGSNRPVFAGVAPPTELRTGTGKPAFAGQGPAAEIRTKGKKAGEPMLRNNYAKIEDVPAGYAFVPSAQHIDTSRTNIGQAEYTKAYTNRPFPVSNELAVQESNDINRLLGRPTRAEAKAAGIALPPQTPGITKHVLESKGTPLWAQKPQKSAAYWVL